MPQNSMAYIFLPIWNQLNVKVRLCVNVLCSVYGASHRSSFGNQMEISFNTGGCQKCQILLYCKINPNSSAFVFPFANSFSPKYKFSSELLDQTWYKASTYMFPELYSAVRCSLCATSVTDTLIIARFWNHFGETFDILFSTWRKCGS